MIVLTPAWKPASALGGFFAMALDTLVALPRRPFAWREFVGQAWFVARVSLVPTVMLAVPYSVLVVFTFNILLLEFGAADFSGTAAAFAGVVVAEFVRAHRLTLSIATASNKKTYPDIIGAPGGSMMRVQRNAVG
jgi:ABC-type transporter Mla maintaining outer membrane lipid asymmetry permease subunit MlaE